MTNKNQIKELADVLFFKINDKQLNLLTKEFSQLTTALAKLNTINVNGVVPTNFPVTVSANTLREDVPATNTNPVNLLKNAPKVLESYVIINKKEK
jgi:aspartyl/glutamyl-tRNA(Asn/Gln) amidotransferase C subunit